MTSLFSTAGTEEEQTEFCFKVYDLNEDGFISREEMLTMMGSGARNDAGYLATRASTRPESDWLEGLPTQKTDT